MYFWASTQKNIFLCDLFFTVWVVSSILFPSSWGYWGTPAGDRSAGIHRLEVELPAVLALSAPCRQSCPSSRPGVHAGERRQYLAPWFGELAVRDELNAGSRSLAEHSESSQMVESGQVSLEKQRLKLNPAPLPCIFLSTSPLASRPLHTSFTISPCACPGSARVGAEAFCCVAGGLRVAAVSPRGSRPRCARRSRAPLTPLLWVPSALLVIQARGQ